MSTTKKRSSILSPNHIADQVLSSSLFPVNDKEDTNDPLSTQVWRMYAQAKDSLPNGSRLENITWRMMAMTLKNKQEGTPTEEPMEIKDSIDIPNDNIHRTKSINIPTHYMEDNYYYSDTLESPSSYQSHNPLMHSSFSIPSESPASTTSFYYNQPSIPHTMGVVSFEDMLTMYSKDESSPTLTIPVDIPQLTNQHYPSPSYSPSASRYSPSISSTDDDISFHNHTTSYRTQTGNTQCSNCATQATPLWRRDPSGNPLCNACGLFYKLHGVVRPLSLKTNSIKKRNRNTQAKSLKDSNVHLSINTTNNNNNNNNQHHNTSTPSTPSTTNANHNHYTYPTYNPFMTTNTLSSSLPSMHQSTSIHQSTSSMHQSMQENHRTHAIPVRPSETLSKRQRRLQSADLTETLSSSLPERSYNDNSSCPSLSSSYNPSPGLVHSSSTSSLASLISNQTNQTNQADVYSLLENIGVQLSNLPPELLPLIASAANYQAMTKQKQNTEEYPYPVNH
ncbi:hypothetical protein BDB01DRAFT_830990 [Pilobolus umbonatus]|nr:hypothetical protein BDB01DRAFT_830990 [Pilobolus umbonatus]